RIKIASRLLLYHSTKHGRTWARQDVTPPNEGLIRYSWMDVGSDGKTIGVGYETHATLDGNWHVYGGISPKFGSPVTYALADPVETAPAGVQLRRLFRGRVRQPRPARHRVHPMHGPRSGRRHDRLPEL